MRYICKCLKILLIIVSVVTFGNILVMYWVPINIPLSSFFIVRTMFVAIIEKQYYLIPIIMLLCVIMFFTAISIEKHKVILPILSLLYSICDFIIVMFLAISAADGYWKTYIISIITSSTLIVLLCIYFFMFKKTDG